MTLVLICVTKRRTEKLKNEAEGRVTRYYLGHSDDSDHFDHAEGKLLTEFSKALLLSRILYFFGSGIYLSGTLYSQKHSQNNNE